MQMKQRPTGVVATLANTGLPQLTSVTGGTMEVVTSPSKEGFSPLDLLYASLASCLVLSARAAAARLDVLHLITDITADVSGEKAHEGVSRVAGFHIRFSIKGEIDAQTRKKIVHDAETEICTISNTLQGKPSFSTQITE